MSMPYVMAWSTACEMLSSLDEACSDLAKWVEVSSPAESEKLYLIANYHRFRQNLTSLLKFRDYINEHHGLPVHQCAPMPDANNEAASALDWHLLSAMNLFYQATQPFLLLDNSRPEDKPWAGLDRSVDPAALQAILRALVQAENIMFNTLSNLHRISREYYPNFTLEEPMEDMDRWDPVTAPRLWQTHKLWTPEMSFRNFKYSILPTEKHYMSSLAYSSAFESACGAYTDSLAVVNPKRAEKWQNATQSQWSKDDEDMKIPTQGRSIWEDIHAVGVELDLLVQTRARQSFNERVGIILPGDSEIYWPRERLRPGETRHHHANSRFVFIKAIEIRNKNGVRLAFKGVKVKSWDPEEYYGEEPLPQNLKFLDLPAEVRNKVYRLVSIDQIGASGRPPRLSETCTRINQEIMPVYRDVSGRNDGYLWPGPRRNTLRPLVLGARPVWQAWTPAKKSKLLRE